MTDDDKLGEHWWPKPLAHVRDVDPWADTDVVVAEIRSFDDSPHTGHRHVFSALVPVSDLAELEKNLARFEYGLQTSGPHPSASPSHPYTPKFWIEAEGPPRRTYEPLVLSWRSHDKTVLQLDPGFAMTYGLVPRHLGNGETRWDDPTAPIYDVASVSAPSVWDFPSGTTACVTVKRDYLRDYLTLRQMALVQVYWEMRWGRTDRAIETRLGGTEGVDIHLMDRRYALRRSWDDKAVIAAQVWGARVIAEPGALPISENALEKDGLIWPGYKEPVTDAMAMQMGVIDMVYVSDTVLAGYEGRPEFRVNPKSGSVGFGTQWTVGFCDRIGRDLIRLELKKLYEGCPPHITRDWHRHAVAPPSKTELVRMAKERDVGTRAEQLVFALVALGESLSRLAEAIPLAGLSPEDFVGLRRKALEYHGWWTFDNIEPIARHIPLALTEDGFLDRCMDLNKLVTEGLSEKSLRLVLRALGVPEEAVEKLRALKLLDSLLCMAQLAEQKGLELPRQGREVWQRLQRDGTEPAQPIERLFSLYELRVLAGHKASSRRERLTKELKRFNLTLGGVGSGYGLLLDGVYELVIHDLEAAKNKINAALAVRKPPASVVEHPKTPWKASTPSPAAKKQGQPHRKRRRDRRRPGPKSKEKPPWE
ncbi:hypothetical protein [Bradyrhizobium sp. sBnM-33]|uniref:hypothetical protein n=1 Tax=Bradyrhizobium sp. sBnM-33 TaxID=2831780 RepID=UPI001BCC9745|nr:hypothetical protein [Bradyrhizobium sp. sBnM-33]WOH47554.1 hypothetical protein RX328_25620 [Bradyrhizobium sp. sBnM-33]